MEPQNINETNQAHAVTEPPTQTKQPQLIKEDKTSTGTLIALLLLFVILLGGAGYLFYLAAGSSSESETSSEATDEEQGVVNDNTTLEEMEDELDSIDLNDIDNEAAMIDSEIEAGAL